MKKAEKILLFGLLGLILVSGCIQNPYKKSFAGIELNFRANLLEAEKTIVYPDEQTLRDLLLDPQLERVKIGIMLEDEMGQYLVSGYELAYKLTIVYKYYFQGTGDVYLYSTDGRDTCMFFDYSQKNICIETVFLNETAMEAGKNEVGILLIGPLNANKTAVTVKGNVIFAEGKQPHQGRKYTDLDLAVDKILLVLME